MKQLGLKDGLFPLFSASIIYSFGFLLGTGIMSFFVDKVDESMRFGKSFGLFVVLMFFLFSIYQTIRCKKIAILIGSFFGILVTFFIEGIFVFISMAFVGNTNRVRSPHLTKVA